MRQINSSSRIKLILASALVLGITACTDKNEQTQVIDRNYTRESQNLGATAERQGDASVQGQRDIVEKRTERVDESVPTVVTGERKADLNRMDEADFRALGLSEKAAKSIVDYRNDLPNDRFTSIDQLRQVPGLDPNWITQHQGLLGISSAE